MAYGWIIDGVTLSGVRAGWVMLGVVFACMLVVITLSYMYVKVLNEEPWLPLFAGGATVLVLQYLVGIAVTRPDFWDLSGLPYHLTLDILLFFQDLCSPANNLLFLGAALAMSGAENKWRKLFPTYAILWALASLLVDRFYLFGPYHGVVDAALSAWVLTCLAIAFHRNFKKWPLGAFFFPGMVGGYALLNLIHGFLPLMVPLLPATFWEAVAERSLSMDATWVLLPLPALSAVNAVLMGFGKLILFLAVLVLAHRCLMLLVGKRLPKLQNDVGMALPRWLAEEIGADLAVFWLRLPGQEQLGLRHWVLDEVEGQKRLALPGEDTTAGKAFFKSEISSHRDCRKNNVVNRQDFTPGSQLSVPIIHEGLTIGVIHAEWRHPLAFTTTTVVALRKMAEILAPRLHQKRQMLALERVERALHQLGEMPLKALAEALTERLLLELSTLGVALWIKQKNNTLGLFREHQLKQGPKTQSGEEFQAWVGILSKNLDARAETVVRKISFSDDDGDMQGLLAFCTVPNLPDQRGILVQSDLFLDVLTEAVRNALYRAYVAELNRERLQTEMKLSEQERPALMMHEFKGQMATVQSGLTNLEDDLVAGDYPRAKARIADIQSNTTSVAELADVFVRPVLGPNLPETGLIEDAVTRVKQRYAEYLEARNIQLVQEGQPGVTSTLPLVTLCLVLNNLLVNAVDAMGREGTVTVTVEKNKKKVLVRVSNPGTIAGEVLARLFEQGFTTKEKGSGMGLYYCRRILKSAKATLSADSTDGTTTMTITMPTLENGGTGT